jgi:hypothetical protein
VQNLLKVQIFHNIAVKIKSHPVLFGREFFLLKSSQRGRGCFGGCDNNGKDITELVKEME